MPEKMVLVTGAAGMVGGRAVEALLGAGHRVRAFVRSETNALAERSRLEVMRGDMTRLEDVRRAISGVDVVVHLAARKNDESDSHAVNVGGATHLALACRESGVGHVVHVSTQSVRLPKRGTYGETQRLAECALRDSGLPVVTLRPSVVYRDLESGILGSIVRFSKLPRIPVVGRGDVLFRPIHVDDLARALVRASENPELAGEPYDVGGPSELDFLGLVDAVTSRTGRARGKLHLPVPLCRLLALVGGPITRSNVLGATQKVPLFTKRFVRDFGFEPRGFEEGLASLELPGGGSDREADAELEARSLLRYVARGGLRSWSPDSTLIDRYLRAAGSAPALREHRLDPIVLRRPMLLAGLDAVAALRSPHSPLRSKLIIAAALIECRPESAAWLLPRDQSRLGVLLAITSASLGATVRLLFGIALHVVPGFVQRNVHGPTPAIGEPEHAAAH